MKRLLFTLALLALASPSWAAFASVSATDTSIDATPATTTTIDLPACASGNFLWVDVNFETLVDPVVTLPAGWNVRNNQANGGAVPANWNYSIIYHADGTQGTSLNLTTVASVGSVHAAYCIADTIGVGIFLGIPSGEGNAPDPANVTPPGGAKDYLWVLAAIENDAPDGCITSAPTNYSNFVQGSDANIGDVSFASRQLNAASEDPGVWGGCGSPSGGLQWLSPTGVVYPQVGDAPKLGRFPAALADSADSTNHACTIPTGITSTMLLLPVIECDATPVITFTGYEHLKTLDNGSRLAAYYRQADGAEDTSAEFTTDSSQQCSCRVHVLKGHESVLVQAPEASTGATGTSTAPDPDSITPTGGAKNYFVLPVFGTDDSTTLTTAPSTYFLSGATSSTGVSGNVSAMTAINQVNGSSIDPGAAVIGASRAWAAFTIVVHPDGADSARRHNWAGAWGSGR